MARTRWCPQGSMGSPRPPRVVLGAVVGAGLGLGLVVGVPSAQLLGAGHVGVVLGGGVGLRDDRRAGRMVLGRPGLVVGGLRVAGDAGEESVLVGDEGLTFGGGG